ncbi:MAG TPA: radical SAM protein [Victivallales bacterium]|nr:radical SAM protein [Victivallales bacterium]
MDACHIAHENFSREEIDIAARSNKLLTLELELSLKCNFHCPYCYVPDKQALKNELTFSEICDVISQAKALGAEKIILLGGEPTLHPNFFKVIEFINSNGMKAEIFTNGSKITQKFADKLYRNNVRTVIKLNSFKPEIMELLTGRPDSYKLAMLALKNLRNAGYPDNKHFLAVSTVICKQNIEEITELWTWLRNQNIEPYFEIITPQGNAKENQWLEVTPEQTEKVFNEIAKIDSGQFNKKWKIQPPLVGSNCLRLLYSCLIDNKGFVKPCVGISESAGNIRENSLSNIIKSSEIIQYLRDYRKRIKGPCSKCDKAEECYGCRGAAFQQTGDPLASDPLCWKNQNKLDQIYSLPYPVKKIIPQTLSMQMIDYITRIGDKTVETEMTVRADNPFLEKNKFLSEYVYAEIIAQTVASANGFYALGHGIKQGIGYVIGIKKMKIFAHAKVGDKLIIKMYKTTKFGHYGVVRGTVYLGSKILAQGELKLFGDDVE